jgi:hypothetical protein
MAKQKQAGANNRDLPWWFEIYHIAWVLSFLAIWYFFGFYFFLLYSLIIASFFAVKA